MPGPKPSWRAVFAIAILVMAGISAWRISGEAALLLHDYHVHLTMNARPVSSRQPAPSLIVFKNLNYGSFACRAEGRDAYRCSPLPPPGAIQGPRQ